MSRLESYLVAAATVLLSLLFSAFSREIRSIFRAGSDGWLAGRRNIYITELTEVKTMHESLTYLVVVVAVRLLRVLFLGFIAIIPALELIRYPAANHRYGILLIEACVGIGIGEIIKGIARFYQVALYDTYEPKTSKKISELELRISKKKNPSPTAEERSG